MSVNLAVTAIICDLCGNEWNSRFGKCPCKFRRVVVHDRDLIISRMDSLPEALTRLTDRLYDDTCKDAEMLDCAGEEPPYRFALGQVDRAIGQLKRFRHDLQALQAHEHVWGSDDYCRICGRDGRA